MGIIRQAATRRTETPNAAMTTLASPTLGESENSLWRVEMTPGSSGPLHAFDVEQIWTVLGGGARIALAGDTVTVVPGDTVIMPAHAPRQVFADTADGFEAVVCASGAARAYDPAAATPEALTAANTVRPAWIA